MIFVSWSYIAKYKDDHKIYDGFESAMMNYEKPMDQGSLEQLVDEAVSITRKVNGFHGVSCTILSIC